MKTVTLISKDDCSLCDKAYDMLKRIHREKEFNLLVKKIEPGTEDFEKYKEKIPVVLVDGELTFVYKLDEQAMRKLL